MAKRQFTIMLVFAFMRAAVIGVATFDIISTIFHDANRWHFVGSKGQKAMLKGTRI